MKRILVLLLILSSASFVHAWIHHVNNQTPDTLDVTFEGSSAQNTFTVNPMSKADSTDDTPGLTWAVKIDTHGNGTYRATFGGNQASWQDITISRNTIQIGHSQDDIQNSQQTQWHQQWMVLPEQNKSDRIALVEDQWAKAGKYQDITEDQRYQKAQSEAESRFKNDQYKQYIKDNPGQLMHYEYTYNIADSRNPVNSDFKKLS